jgi:hypothetical protein
VVIGVFWYRNYFGSIDDGWRAAFSYSSGYYFSTIPLESMKSASLSNHRVALPMTSTNYCREKNVSFNYIFFLDWICLFAFWRKGRPLEVS